MSNPRNRQFDHQKHQSRTIGGFQYAKKVCSKKIHVGLYLIHNANYSIRQT